MGQGLNSEFRHSRDWKNPLRCFDATCRGFREKIGLKRDRACGLHCPARSMRLDANAGAHSPSLR